MSELEQASSARCRVCRLTLPLDRKGLLPFHGDSEGRCEGSECCPRCIHNDPYRCGAWERPCHCVCHGL